MHLRFSINQLCVEKPKSILSLNIELMTQQELQFVKFAKEVNSPSPLKKSSFLLHLANPKEVNSHSPFYTVFSSNKKSTKYKFFSKKKKTRCT